MKKVATPRLLCTVSRLRCLARARFSKTLSKHLRSGVYVPKPGTKQDQAGANQGGLVEASNGYLQLFQPHDHFEQQGKPNSRYYT